MPCGFQSEIWFFGQDLSTGFRRFPQISVQLSSTLMRKPTTVGSGLDQQLPIFHRLGQVVIEASLFGGHSIFSARDGDQHERLFAITNGTAGATVFKGVGAFLRFTQIAGSVIPVHLWHLNIQQHDVRLPVVYRSQGVRAGVPSTTRMRRRFLRAG